MKIILTQKNKIIGLLLFLLLVLVLLKLFSSQQKVPQIIETQPKEKSQQVALDTQIVFTFDQKITSEKWEVTFSPDLTAITQIKENKIEIKPSNPLKPNTTYQITLKNSLYKNFSFSLSFSTVPEVITPVTYGRGDPNFYNQIQKETTEEYPLLKDIPYKTEFWWIAYRGPLKLIVVMKKDSQGIRKEALDWIKSKGVDPETHKIEWKVSP